MGDEAEALGKEGAEHGLNGGGSGAGRNHGPDIEPIDFAPVGTAQDLPGIDAVREADEVQHGGVADLVLAAFEADAEFQVGRAGAGAKVRDFKAGRVFRGLGSQRESGDQGQADCRKHILC